MNLFELLYDSFKFDKNKPIRLFEAFSGIGTQGMALKRLGCNIEYVGISEIDRFALQSYYAIHGKGIKNYGGVGEFDKFPKDIDIITWSFPCQDISLAGKQKGMVDGSRSNYGYVFLDMIENMDFADRPKVMLMENVRALFSKTFENDWREIHERLERMGYTSNSEILNAKNFGVAQNRERIFIVSIKNGDDGKQYNYTFPKPFKLKKKLKDYLENNVDEKYYLSAKLLNTFLDSKNRNGYVRSEVFRPHEKDSDYAYTITTKAGSRPSDNFIIMPEATKKGFTLARDGDGVYIDRPHQKRGVVQKGMIQTIKTQQDLAVIELQKPINDLLLYYYNDIYYSANEKYYKTGDLIVVDKENKAYILTKNNQLFRIRRLTPSETWRLMGISDEDFYKAFNDGVSDSQLYKQAGNAIVVDVLVAIFREMLK